MKEIIDIPFEINENNVYEDINVIPEWVKNSRTIGGFKE